MLSLSPDLKQCGKCKLAYFCNRDCQMKYWPSHKRCHKRCCSMLAKGPDLYGDPADPFPMTYDAYPGNYVRENRAVWEYDAASLRGRPDWRRYPDGIEAGLESLFNLGAPKYMYKPGDREAEGMYESTRTRHPAVHVVTRHVSFDGLFTEREVYTGASRSVRRNGRRILRDDGEDHSRPVR